MEEKYGYQIKVLVLTKSYLKKVFDGLPLVKIEDLDTKKLGITFLKKFPSEESIEKVISIKAIEEHLVFNDKVCYLYCPNGFGRTKLTNNNLETKLKTSATSRNWNTITKLVELSNQ